MAEQLIKKEGQGYSKVYPTTFIDSVKDKTTGLSLPDILSNFNCYFLSYANDAETTRLLVPSYLRRKGLWITYIPYTGKVTTEYYSADEIDDDSWVLDKNWRDGSNSLVGDISITTNGYWVINGEVTNINAKGEQGISPLLRIYENKLQVSYDEGRSFVFVNDTPIAAWFRWKEAESNNTLGKIQISRDENKQEWQDLSPEFANSLKVQAYYTTVDEAPTNVADGYIIMTGPIYDESNLPKYELYIRINNSWKDVGSFQSIQAGIAGEIAEDAVDNGATVPTTEAVVEYIKTLKQQIFTLENQLNGLTIAEPISESEYEEKAANGELDSNSLYLVYEDETES